MMIVPTEGYLRAGTCPISSLKMGQLMIDFKDQYLFLFLGCQYMKL